MSNLSINYSPREALDSWRFSLGHHLMTGRVSGIGDFAESLCPLFDALTIEKEQMYKRVPMDR